MKTGIRFLLVCLIALSPVLGRAENEYIEHEFHSMPGRSEIEFSNAYRTAKTHLLTYTCSGGAVFGLDLVNNNFANKQISINYSGQNQVMTTTAIEELSGIDIFYYYKTANNGNKQLPDFALTLSYDSIHWSSPISNEASTPGVAYYDFVPGKYFVRLENFNNYSASVFKIIYHFGESCNCFIYIPE